MNFFQMLVSTADLCSNESGIGFIIDIVKFVLNVIQWGIPIVLIVLISIDLFKAMASAKDEKEQKEIQKKAIKRVVYAVIIFLVPVLIKIVFNLIPTIFKSSDVDSSEAANFFTCWNSK